jgi:hypothetical protein
MHDISIRTGDTMQISLEQLFSQSEQNAAGDVVAARIKAV